MYLTDESKKSCTGFLGSISAFIFTAFPPLRRAKFMLYSLCMPENRSIFSRDVLSWGLYDFANTIYSMNILSLYFAGWLIVDLGFEDIHYSLAYSFSMLLAAILMPALGYFSDSPSGCRGLKSQKRLFFLGLFTLGAVLSVLLFSFLPVAFIIPILVFFGLSNFFFEGGMVFYNALLDSVSDKTNVGKISGFGVSLGYLGSIVGMILVLPFVTGSLFGLDIPIIEGAGKSGAFIPTAILYALFALPIFLWVRERPIEQAEPRKLPGGLKAAYKDIWKTIKATERYPGVLRFLISDYFFEDAIATVIIFMAVFTERVLGLSDSDRTVFFIISTVFAMIGAYLFGLMADRFSPKKVLGWIVTGWIVVLVIFALNSIPTVFWICGPIVGVLLGGVWAVSRPLLILLTPREKLGEFFGLFSLSGRAAAVCGPVLWGVVVTGFAPDSLLGNMLSSSMQLSAAEGAKLPYRLAVLSLAAMMALGLFIYRKVPEGKSDDEK